LREKEGLHVLPAATAGLAGLLDLNNLGSLEPDRYVAILTGKK
jgi:threonine synthase